MWGWLVACYLFLGGLSAGLFCGAALLQLAWGRRFGRTVRRCVGAALGLLAVGCALLLADVGVPLRALNVLQSFANLGTSWMARGVWVISGCLVCYGLYLFVLGAPFRKGGGLWYWRQRILNGLGIAGMALSVALALYTGFLLRDAYGIAWWHTMLLPVLFLVSSLEAGGAATAWVLGADDAARGCGERSVRAAESVVAVLTVAELVLLAWYIATGAGSAAAMGVLAEGPARFWLGGAGLLLVVALVLTAARRWTRGSPWRATASAACSLAAGLMLRFGVLSLGVHLAPLL